MKVNLGNKWFGGVDSLRFVMAVIVMFSHFDNVYAMAMKESTHSFIRYLGYFWANAFDGTSAVIAFFIISGFVIHYPNKNGIRDLKEFWIRRFVRILIPLCVILILGALFGHPEKTVVWSLFCELIYYAIYPFLAKIALSWRNKFIIAYILSGLVVIFFAWADIVAFFKHSDINYQGYYWQLGVLLTWIIGLPCWLLGVLIAEHIDDLKDVTFKSVIAYRIGVYFVSCLCCFAKFHMHLSYIVTMNVFALLLYKWIKTEITYYKNAQPIPVMEKMGKFSYSLYLCHPVLNVIIGIFFANTIFTYPVFILLAILLSYCFYLAVEKPSHLIARKINSKYNPVIN